MGRGALDLPDSGTVREFSIVPSMLHEALVSLFHHDPTLAPDLLNRALGVQVPEHASATVEDVTLNEVQPAEYRADAVVVLREVEPVLAIVVEVQLREDPKKLYSWPVYAMNLRARMCCPATVLVLTPELKIAEWASTPIGIGPGSTFSVMAVGPGSIPRIGLVDEARRSPELAVLSVVAHGEHGSRAMALAALHAVAELDDERATLYNDLILSALGDAARSSLEELMRTKYEFQSDFAKKYVSIGREEGREEGRASGVRDVLFRMLGRAGLKLDEATQKGIDGASAESLDRIVDDLIGVTDPELISEKVRSHFDR